MTDIPPQDDSAQSRLTAIEIGLRHFQEISDIRNQQTQNICGQLQHQVMQLDREMEEKEEKLLSKISEIHALLWSGMKWLGGLLTVTLLSIIFKALRLL